MSRACALSCPSLGEGTGMHPPSHPILPLHAPPPPVLTTHTPFFPCMPPPPLLSQPTHRLVQLVREEMCSAAAQGQRPALLGAKITGGGCGGTVCIMGRCGKGAMGGLCASWGGRSGGCLHHGWVDGAEGCSHQGWGLPACVEGLLASWIHRGLGGGQSHHGTQHGIACVEGLLASWGIGGGSIPSWHPPSMAGRHGMAWHVMAGGHYTVRVVRVPCACLSSCACCCRCGGSGWRGCRCSCGGPVRPGARQAAQGVQRLIHGGVRIRVHQHHPEGACTNELTRLSRAVVVVVVVCVGGGVGGGGWQAHVGGGTTAFLPCIPAALHTQHHVSSSVWGKGAVPALLSSGQPLALIESSSSSCPPGARGSMYGRCVRSSSSSCPPRPVKEHVWEMCARA